MPSASISKLINAPLPDEARELLDTYVESARILGERTAALHLALAAETENQGFTQEIFSSNTQRGLFQSLRSLTRQNFQLLNRQLKMLSPEMQAQAQQLLAREPDVLKYFRAIYDHGIDTTLIRYHGNYHLGQVLYTGKDFLITDFEGEPSIPISERRLKRSPLQDVASMIRSFHYAAYAALFKQAERGSLPGKQLEPMISWSQYWSRWISVTFYRSYLQAAAGAAFLPQNEADLQMMLNVFLLRKAIYELGHELNNRPEWVHVPLQGILELLNEQTIPATAAKETTVKETN